METEPSTLAPFSTAQPEDIRVLQFTDTHLFATAQGTLHGLPTALSLQAVLNHALATCWPADVVLATGDLIHDDSIAAYQRFLRVFESLDAPTYCLPGNHDIPEFMMQELQGSKVSAPRHVLLPHWQLILLDTTLPGSEKGHLAETELAWLRQCLQAYPTHHALVCLHHSLAFVGSFWLDTMAIDNSESFFEIVNQYTRVRGVLWGHIHQEYDQYQNGVRLLGSPSTSIQFRPESQQFALDNRTPGYRWLLLRPDGRLQTGIQRIAETDYAPLSVTP